MKKSWEVVLTFITEDGGYRSLRFPAMEKERSYALAADLKRHFPNALIEVAYGGCRTCV